MLVDSPCVHICVLDKQDVCRGCYRTREEIANWQKYTNKEKQAVINRIKQNPPQ